MAYNKQTFVDKETTLSAAHLNHMEDGIVNASKERHISILFVGNSLTQDGIAYLPYMLKTYYPEVDFKIYMWYIGGKTLGDHYSNFTSSGKAEIFSVAENSATWTNHSKNTTMAQVLSTYTFDMVCMQEYFNYKTEYTDATDWNNCRDYIVANYKGGNALEFVSLFHAPLRNKADAVFDMTKNGNALILQETISQDMIPNGIAVYRALSTDLNTLGDKQQLSPDGTHTQEGLPCLLQTYVTLCWLFDRLGINKSVYGSPMRMTTAIYNSISVPGANLGNGVVTGTDAQNLLAQEVAIKAYKEGKKFVIANLCKESFNSESEPVKTYCDRCGMLESECICKITSISAEFVQGNATIFDEQDIDGLRKYLVVTANYEDGTSEVVSGYTLSGTLTAGTSTITVAYEEQTATFDVAVTAVIIPEGYTRYGYIEKKTATQSKATSANFIYLKAYEDMNALSMEATLGYKSGVTTYDGAGVMGARLSSGDSYPYYGVYWYSAGVMRFFARNTKCEYSMPTNTTKVKIVADNPDTSPLTVKINDGEAKKYAWTSSPVIPYGMSLFNNIPNGSTDSLYINRYVRIGDLIFRNADGECVGYYTPCVYDGKIGMYDQISQAFYTAETAAAVTVSASGCYYAVGNW